VRSAARPTSTRPSAHSTSIVLFGGGAGLTVTIGQAVGQNMTIGASNLRDGDMVEIIEQDNAGDFGVSVTDSDAIEKITAAIQDIATERATLGASQSRLELASTTLSVERENLSSAISRIRDIDVADESTQYAKYNILVQSGTAMLAQANLSPQSVLKLLQG
jgi:flagellin